MAVLHMQCYWNSTSIVEYVLPLYVTITDLPLDRFYFVVDLLVRYNAPVKYA